MDILDANLHLTSSADIERVRREFGAVSSEGTSDSLLNSKHICDEQ
jgi:hypothetical protein